jgi:hypothetical protein
MEMESMKKYQFLIAKGDPDMIEEGGDVNVE